ncbi:class III lanthionine synthetase LanKC [Streptomyces sp. NPDC059063]|uniref:class III lanthionine synthetase LanKC n=1 Tax=unclassified Streptomyces TaxID=2593676 RepID=UPI00368CF4CA
MIEHQQLYGWADAVFYENPGRRDAPETHFAATDRVPPAGWERTERDVWISLRPTDAATPEQGWKIHVSATADTAERTVDEVWDHCTEHGVPFKFLRDTDLFWLHNSKYYPRSGSGKLVTVYPRDEAELTRTLEGLEARIGGWPGAYILSDLRYAEGPLHVRYGGFASRYCTDAAGDRVLAIAGPDGTLVPDERRPGRFAPTWAPVPDVLAPHVERRRAGAKGFPYRVERALHFSNGGGVYLAERLSDAQQVVLKEARPHAGLDQAGRDAVARLRNESEILRRLAGTPGVPELYETFESGEHHFMAMEYVKGDMLWVWLGAYHPMLQYGSGAAEEAEYTAGVLDMADRVEQLVAAMHAKGVVFGDLHPGNILVRPDGSLAILDFETAFELDGSAGTRPTLGAPGFMAPREFTDAAVDHYSLAALRLWLFLPLNRMFPLSRTKLAETVDAVERRFPYLPAGFGDRIREATRPPAAARTGAATTTERLFRAQRAVLDEPLDVDLDAAEIDWQAVRDSLAAAIRRSADPGRTDRLFPGDIQQFVHDGVNLAHGAAGVLWALDATGQGRDAAYEEWLSEAARRAQLRPGFYSGLHGVAHVLDGFGRADEARELVERARGAIAGIRDVSLYGGMAGAGLNLLHLAARHDDEDYRAQARALAERAADALRAPESPGTPRPNQAGLLYGWSGVALFFLRLAEESGDCAYTDLALRAVHRDLDACLVRADGSMQVDDGIRSLAYLQVGSSGIALVADEILTHTQDEVLAAALPRILRACQAEYVLEPHLFNGRTGLMAVLARLGHHDPDGRGADAVDRHLRRLTWHKLAYHGHLAFSGNQSWRLSMDLASGNAGVLLGMTAALDPGRPFLPFLSPRPGGRGTTDPTSGPSH